VHDAIHGQQVHETIHGVARYMSSWDSECMEQQGTTCLDGTSSTWSSKVQHV